MKDVFNSVSEFLFQAPLKWSKQKSDATLTKIVEKVQSQTGWTWNEALFAVFIPFGSTGGITDLCRCLRWPR